MAAYDDRRWMLSLIQNAYVTTDDTGLCEVILERDEGKKHIAEFPFLLQIDDLLHSQVEPEPHSPDITLDSELPRHRSYTERKSERLKKEREKASRVKRITWRHHPRRDVNDSELSEMFQRKVVITRSSDTSDGEPPPKSTSMLSHLLQNCQHKNINAFIEYSKFDGMTHNNVARKQIKIFLYIGKNPSLDYPLRVSVVSSARVVDLIGLICWLYTKENRQPPVKTVDHYELHIADEDGQCDWEFQPLEKRHLIDKYGFNTLALVEKEVPESNQGIIVTVNFARGAFSKIEVGNKDVVTLREILNKSISRRKEIAKMKEAGVDYHLEKENEPGVVLNLDKTIVQVNCTEFAAVRDNSKRTNGREIRNPNLLDIASPQSFIVIWEKKFSKFETKIDISGDKLEIHPLPLKGSNSILAVRAPLPLLYHIGQLIDCNKRILKKSKLEILITIQGEHNFKGFKFICDAIVGQEIYEKCHYLIKINVSKSIDKKPSFRRHNSLSLRKKAKNGTSSFEV